MTTFRGLTVGIFCFAIFAAQSALSWAKSENASALPPPNLQDAGVAAKPALEIETKSKASGVVRDESDTLPEKARGNEPPPTVTIRVEGNNTIEEYRQGDKLYMVRVTPKRGIPYTFLDTDNDGRLEGDPKEGSLQPNYYTIYEWE